MGTVSTQLSPFQAALLGGKSGISETFVRPFTQAEYGTSYQHTDNPLETEMESFSGLSSPEKPGNAEKMQTVGD